MGDEVVMKNYAVFGVLCCVVLTLFGFSYRDSSDNEKRNCGTDKSFTDTGFTNIEKSIKQISPDNQGRIIGYKGGIMGFTLLVLGWIFINPEG